MTLHLYVHIYMAMYLYVHTYKYVHSNIVKPHLYFNVESILAVSGALGQQVGADALEVVVLSVEGGDVRVAPRAALARALPLRARPLAALAVAGKFNIYVLT